MRERGRVVEANGNVAKLRYFGEMNAVSARCAGLGHGQDYCCRDKYGGAKCHDEWNWSWSGSGSQAAAIVYLIPLAFLLVGLYLGTVFASFIDQRDMAQVLQLSLVSDSWAFVCRSRCIQQRLPYLSIGQGSSESCSEQSVARI